VKSPEKVGDLTDSRITLAIVRQIYPRHPLLGARKTFSTQGLFFFQYEQLGGWIVRSGGDEARRFYLEVSKGNLKEMEIVKI
jgi:hypothetical protein